MGTQLTKIGHAVNDDEPVQASLASTPILTPKSRILDLDPRSPTANIVRTPIQVITGINKSYTPIIGELKSSAFETTLDDSTCEIAAVNLDPRSPSVEFTRTPIVIDKSSVIIRNKNLDNVKKQITDFTPFKIKSKDVETEKNNTNISAKLIKGPKLLESSPLVKNNDQNEKRKSFVGLLETNLDYFETNLDTVSKKLQTEFALCNDEKEESLLESIPEISNKSISEIETPVNEIINQNAVEIQNNEMPINAELEVDKNNVHEETINKINQIDEDIKEVLAVSIDPTSDCDKTNLCQIDEEVLIQKPFISVEPENLANDFDKKVTNLIYEDQETYESPVKSNKTKNTNRTPLGDRNRMNHKQKSGISKLKVHDKPKSDYAVSKIPVFKDKTYKSKTMQCENTPPAYKLVESKIKKSQWDADNTLII